jgi:hypothetical protein
MNSLVASERVELEHAVRRRISALLHAAGVDDHEVQCEVRGNASDLGVVLFAPAACSALTQAIKVRVLDAVHAAGRTFGEVSVETHFGD